MTCLSSRPLLASDADVSLFVDRERDLALIDRTVASGLNTLLVGGRGTGKTSTLHQVERRLAEAPGLEPVFVEGAGRVERPEELLSLIAFRLGAERAPLSLWPDAVQSMVRRPPSSETEQLLAGLRTVRQALAQSQSESRVVFLVDELGSGEVAHSLFGQLRDELWSLPATWVVAADASREARYLRAAASAFFETVVQLGPLSKDHAIELLRLRTAGMRVSRRLLERLADAAEGSPAALISLARAALVEGRDPTAAVEERAERARRARELGDAAARLLEYLEAHGPASASDEELMSELDWSRSRATQVFRQLEEAGVVRAATESSGAGRRKVYSLAESEPVWE